MKYCLSVVLTIFIVVLSSCAPQDVEVVNQTQAIPAEGWHRFENLSFDFEVKDIEVAHSIVLHFMVDAEAENNGVRFQALLDIEGAQFFNSFDISELNDIEVQKDAQGESYLPVSTVIFPQQYFPKAGAYNLQVKPLMPHLYTVHIKSVNLVVMELHGRS